MLRLTGFSSKHTLSILKASRGDGTTIPEYETAKTYFGPPLGPRYPPIKSLGTNKEAIEALNNANAFDPAFLKPYQALISLDIPAMREFDELSESFSRTPRTPKAEPELQDDDEAKPLSRQRNFSWSSAFKSRKSSSTSSIDLPGLGIGGVNWHPVPPKRKFSLPAKLGSWFGSK